MTFIPPPVIFLSKKFLPCHFFVTKRPAPHHFLSKSLQLEQKCLIISFRHISNLFFSGRLFFISKTFFAPSFFHKKSSPVMFFSKKTPRTTIILQKETPSSVDMPGGDPVPPLPNSFGNCKSRWLVIQFYILPYSYTDKIQYIGHVYNSNPNLSTPLLGCLSLSLFSDRQEGGRVAKVSDK